MLLLVGVEPIDSVDVLRVRLVEVGERYHDGRSLRKQTEHGVSHWTHPSIIQTERGPSTDKRKKT